MHPMRHRVFIVALAIAALTALPSNGRAVTVQNQLVAHNVPYVIGFHPLHSSAQPYLGQLYLNFNHGIVSGTYTDMSIRPGSPFAYMTNIPVSGGVSDGQITLNVRTVTFRGTFNGTTMHGSATIHGQIFTFSAQRGKPGSGGR
jgi:hypothetical protein